MKKVKYTIIAGDKEATLIDTKAKELVPHLSGLTMYQIKKTLEQTLTLIESGIAIKY